MTEDTPQSDGLDDQAGLDALLDYLHRTRAFDFSAYKKSSLTRRILKRMQAIDVRSYEDYVDFLKVHPNEFPQLFNTVLINVTGFYRDPDAWEALSGHLQRLIQARPPDRPIRLWSAGCASGEEAYSLAIVLAEAMGMEEFAKRVKIYATDVDEEALNHGRGASYSEREVEGLAPHLLDRHFTRVGSMFLCNKDLRRSVIFGRHDLVKDAPISRVDALACRNTLMYLNADTQTRILNKLHFALNDDGILFLGKAEMLLTHASLFTPLDLKLRLFSRVSKGRSAGRALSPRATPRPESEPDDKNEICQAAFDASSLAQVVIDASGTVILVNSRATTLFGLSSRDVGRPFHELELSYRPAELRSYIDKAQSERRILHLKEIERTLPGGETMCLDIEVAPLASDVGAALGVHLSFADTTQHQRLRQELRRSNLELEEAHEELQSTSEELETTNEELQSTVEELETTNEELQSTNEELETMNEELQSTNEELQTMNEELQRRGDELNQVNSFFESILASLRAGVVVLDNELIVKAWNHRMEDLWGLRTDEVIGKHFLILDIGLPLELLSAPIRTSLSTQRETDRVIECTNRRGRTIQCRVTVSPLRGDGQRGVVLLFDEASP